MTAAQADRSEGLFDLIVVGAGAAGAACALEAAGEGARVCLAWAGAGATALSSGALDLAADPWEVPGAPWTGRPPSSELYARARLANQAHPLSLAALSWQRGLELLRRLTDRLPLLAPPSDRPPLVLPTDLGTFKSTTTASRWAAAADLPTLRGGRAGVVGIRGFPGYPAPHLARSLGHLAAAGGVELELLPVEVELLRVRGEELMSPVDLARRVEQPALLDRMLSDLSREQRRLGLSHLLLPPVMGLDRWEEVRERVTALAPAGELLCGPPSVPGLRLQQALERALRAAGVSLLRGRAVSASRAAGGRRLQALTLEDGRDLAADAFVLATGKFTGGGLVHDRLGLRDPLLGLPIWTDPEGPSADNPGGLMARAAAGPHPLMRAGVRVDRQLRPLGAGGEVVLDNLFAAGSLLGGWDSISGRDGLGTALLTGALAGGNAVRAGGEVP